MMAADLEGLPEEDKHRMATLIDQLQIRDRFVCLVMYKIFVNIYV